MDGGSVDVCGMRILMMRQGVAADMHRIAVTTVEVDSDVTPGAESLRNSLQTALSTGGIRSLNQTCSRKYGWYFIPADHSKWELATFSAELQHGSTRYPFTIVTLFIEKGDTLVFAPNRASLLYRFVLCARGHVRLHRRAPTSGWKPVFKIGMNQSSQVNHRRHINNFLLPKSDAALQERPSNVR